MVFNPNHTQYWFQSGQRLLSSNKEVVMEAQLSGRVRHLVDQILNSRDPEWIDILSVTVAVLHRQFTLERRSAAPPEDFDSLQTSKPLPTAKVQKQSA